MMTETTEVNAQDPPIAQLAFGLIVLAVPTLLWNRALLPALPGSRSGIEGLFDLLALCGAFLSQLLAILLTLLLFKLVVSNLGTFTAGHLGRFLLLPIGSAVGFLLIASTVGPLDAEMHLLLAGLGTAALLCCLAPSLRHPTLRAAGLLFAFAALACLTGSIGRFLALKASVEALPHEYHVARWLTTIGQTFDALGLFWISAWLVLSRKPQAKPPDDTAEPSWEQITTRARLAVALAVAVTCALLSQRGQASTASFFEVVLGRAVTSLAREPSPFGFVTLGPTLDLFAVFLALILLTRPKHVSHLCRWSIALVLLGRASPDIPAHCALMTAGALLLTWYAPSSTSSTENLAKIPEPTANSTV